MPLTALQIVQAACDELGLLRPNAAITATDQQTIQMVGLLNKVGSWLVSEHEWQRLVRAGQISTQSVSTTGDTTSGSTSITNVASVTGIVAGDSAAVGAGLPRYNMVTSVSSGVAVVSYSATATAMGVALTFPRLAYPLPSDFGRLINRTNWDMTNRWEMDGPQSSQGWSWFRGGIASIGPRLRYRIQGNKMLVDPAPAAGLDLRFEYMSARWTIVGAAEFSGERFINDADTCVFRDRLMVAGLKLEFFKAKGFDITTLQREFDEELARATSQDAGVPTLSLSASAKDLRFITTDNLPDGGYGL